jgi:hypothetical protein
MLHSLETRSARTDGTQLFRDELRPVRVDSFETLELHMRRTFQGLVGQKLTEISRNPAYQSLDSELVTKAYYRGVTEFLRFAQPGMAPRLEELISLMKQGITEYAPSDLSVSSTAESHEHKALAEITKVIFDTLVSEFFAILRGVVRNPSLKNHPTVELTAGIQVVLESSLQEVTEEALYMHLLAYGQNESLAWTVTTNQLLQ